MSFVHLHVHSEYSLLDGANRIPDLIRRAKKFEMPALALTDHGCLFGAWTFQKQAKREDIKPIVGMEAYVAPGDRRDRSTAGQGERAYYHLVLLARDRTGYRNLVKLSSIGYTEGFYHKPRIDREVLRAHSDGVIVSSACMAGELARRLVAGDDEAARETAAWYADVFRDRYYLEVQAHTTEGQAELNRKVFGLADEMGLPVVATNDSHFLRREDHEAHDVLLCIGLGKDRNDDNRMRYDDGLYFKSADEMAEHFPDRPDVLENTLAIADQVDLTLDRQYHLPEFPLPERHHDADDYLVELTEKGAREHYGDPLPDEVRERLDYELGVILETGYAGYFLIVWDFIDWAKRNGIPVGPGRGSAAGSLVSYVLGITSLDPLEYDLLFERFLNPERISMPDIDIDFCFERRGRVIEYVREKYGRDAVGQIITFGTMKARAVIRDVGRTLEFQPSETDRIAKMIPNAPGSSFTVEEAVEKLPEVRELYEEGGRYRQLFDYSMVLEGLARHASVHAAGVVIAPGPLDDYVPVCTPPGKSGGNGAGDEAMDVVTQYDMNCLEDAGMLKMDFLGLTTLTIIHDAVEMIRERVGALEHPETGETWDSMDDVPLDDPAVYEMLAQGGTSGVFQFESNLATEKLRAMRCDRFEDLVATNALIRPGPLDSGMTDHYIRRKLGREEVRYPHPDLEKTLEATYGIIVYQEQVMRIADVLAGYSLGEADVLRKAVGKKIPELIAEEMEKFVGRAVERGVDRRTAEELAEQIETFGRYGFNRAHSAAYSLLAYQTAWLKVHYPAEFMAAQLSAVLSSTDRVVKYIGECREMGRHLEKVPEGIEVLAPDVNESGWKFTAIGRDTIRFGLGAVRGVGSSAVQSILEAREEGGAFDSLFDFLQRVDLRALNKRATEALICAGALDAFDTRARMMAGLDVAYSEVQAREQEREMGQHSLFGGEDAVVHRPDPELPEVEPWPEAERLAKEKETLGFFISGHPLERFDHVVRAFGPAHSMNLEEHAGRSVELPCVVTSVSKQLSKRDSSEWGRIVVEDFHGTATVLAFGDTWKEAKEIVEQDAVVLVRGKVSGRERDEDDPPIFLDDVELLKKVPRSGRLAIRIEMEEGADLPHDAFRRAKEVLSGHPGPAPVELVLRNGHGNGAGSGEPTEPAGDSGVPDAGSVDADHGPVRFRSRTLRADPDRDTLGELKELFGPARVRLARCGDGA